MHTTNREALRKIVENGNLEAPISGASWSYSGTLREGDVAIRLTPEGKKFVVLIPDSEGKGLVPKYYRDGAGVDGKGIGQFNSYVPGKYLEYYNWQTDQWRPVRPTKP